MKKTILVPLLLACVLPTVAAAAGSTVYLGGGEELTPYFQIGGTSACTTLVATNAVHFTVGASRTTPFRLASGGTLAVREKGAITLEDVESATFRRWVKAVADEMLARGVGHFAPIFAIILGVGASGRP